MNIERLINRDQHVLVEFSKGETHIPNLLFKRLMQDPGISVPFGMRTRFNHQEYVKLSDAFFQQAFKEIYVPLVLNKITASYQWVSSSR